MGIDIAAARRALGFAQIAESLRVALIVGTVLNLINQGDALFTFGHVDWSKLLLTYSVPFAVATYSSYRAYRALNRAKGGG